MKQYLTPHDIANTVRMMRPVYEGSVVLVEGDSDARVYGRFVDDDHCVGFHRVRLLKGPTPQERNSYSLEIPYGHGIENRAREILSRRYRLVSHGEDRTPVVVHHREGQPNSH